MESLKEKSDKALPRHSTLWDIRPPAREKFKWHLPAPRGIYLPQYLHVFAGTDYIFSSVT